jgi:acyl carrier protein
MTKEEFIQEFIEALEIEDASLVQETTVFKDLEEWDSLAALSTISLIGDEFGVTINNKVLRSVDTLGELYDLVIEKTK